MLAQILKFFLQQRLVAVLLLIFGVMWGLRVAPFEWDLGSLPRDPVPVDAIPDIGENQQIVFTNWPGRSPQDIEDQITYPLTVSLLGLPGVRTIRSTSAFGFSTIYVIFEDDIEFYWSRSRVLEKLNSLGSGTLPEGVQPALGPDATGLGQIYWYTLEGRDEDGQPTGGWGPDELRSIQDWTVRYALMAAGGVSEVASIGGFVREYQVDVDPDAMRANRVTLDEVFRAVRDSNLEVGAKVVEINRAEYFLRGRGWVTGVDDLEQSVIKSVAGVPIRIIDVAHVSTGPALRRGALDKGGSDATGGVVVVRYGENPMKVIKNVKDKIAEIAPGLPRKTLPDGRVSQVTVIPFYDRTGLIQETLGTLEEAISLEILFTIIVVIFMVAHLRSSVLITALLPVAVLMTFVLMKTLKVDANIVALSGIAIAIGTMVDMGIVLSENILQRLREAGPEEKPLDVVLRATNEVASAVLTAVITTIVSFLPVFSMIGAEGKLFKPLAYTKTFALTASVVIALLIIPPFALFLFPRRETGPVGWFTRIGDRLPRLRGRAFFLVNALAVGFVAIVIARFWEPLGPTREIANLVFVLVTTFGLLSFFLLFHRWYEGILRWSLQHKLAFLSVPVLLMVFGLTIWLGFDRAFGFVPRVASSVGVERESIYSTTVWTGGREQFPGLGKEFMPSLDEGSFLYMPTTMPHASIGEVIDVLGKLDRAIESIPEVEMAVGKLGRVESALDPAPISMIEIVINYAPEYKIDAGGKRLRFRYDERHERFPRTLAGELIEDEDGRPFRNWRPHVQSSDDIWDEIVAVSALPGTTSAPRLQPMAARLVMLQSGMRAPMGVKVKGPDLESIEMVGLQVEKFLKEVPSVEPAAVFADRVVGKPYLEIEIDRRAAARYGMSIRKIHDVIEIALGGRRITTTVEGRERYPVRVRYQRELRDSVEDIMRVVVPTPGGAQIPLSQLATIEYVRGPQAIKTEDTFLTSYVLFDKRPGWAEVDVVEQCQAYLREKFDSGEFILPDGVPFPTFAGSYENQVRAAETLSVVLPGALFLIFLILYMQFRSVSTTFMVFSGVFVAWSGGFILIWLYGKPWFMDFDFLGANMRELFQIGPLNLSVAVWVGFLALFGIATDDGVVIATYLGQSLDKDQPATIPELREAVVRAGKRRARPCLMTTATTLLALLPVLTSTGRGADVMVPMAVPSVGGMSVALITMFVVPVLYSWVHERRLARGQPLN